MKLIKLEWGHTPFDKLTHEELLRHCQRLFAANSSMLSCLEQLRSAYDKTNPYWADGSGGNAIEEGEIANAAVVDGFDAEHIYRSFFRTARDLLFNPRLGFNWHICSICDVMIGPMWPIDYIGNPCDRTENCAGVYRRLTWDDLKPVEQ